KVMHYRRSAARAPAMLGLEAAESIAAEMSEMQDELAARQAAFLDCVKELPPPAASLIRDRYESGLTVDVMAANRGATVHAIYKALSRLREVLAQCVAKKISAGGAA
ncbi:MAG: hypothetical protein K8T25_21045, partial [Planctomycetia bacterium]|nr:hypothetical protein [Planctomycetia bacterium]